jgi:hypothetical protein
MGFKYGNRGLLFKADTANQRTTEILISQDPEKIFDFLGFDFSRYLRGFDEVLDIFDYVTNSKYFSKELYLMENRNNKGRTRDKKRNTYMLFLKHIENLTETKHPLQARAVYEAEAEKVFSNFNQQKNILCAAIKNKKELRQKFNGDLVMKLTNKKGPELGNFIREFKSQYTDFDAWVENETQENIESSINDFLLKQLR